MDAHELGESRLLVRAWRLEPSGRATLAANRWRASAKILLVVVISTTVLVAAIAFMLGPIAEWIGGQTVAAITPAKDRAAALTAVRQTLLAALAGVVATVGLVFTARTYLLSRRTHFSDRFQNAIALLAGESTTARLGGVYALEHLMRESPDEHEAIVDVLTDFVRTSASRT